MRYIDKIILHCSATRENQSFDISDIRRWHIEDNGWEDVGYHYYIKFDGTIQKGRDIEKVGAHCKGHNKHSIGICLEGGLDEKGKTKDTRTIKQKESLDILLTRLKKRFPEATIHCHNEFANKECPSFKIEDL